MPEPLTLRLLRRLHQSPYAAPLTGDWRVALRAERSWLLYGKEGLSGVKESIDGPVDAELRLEPGDLEKILTGQAPDQKISLILGERAIPPRRAQAHGLCAAAALGWAGPWPDPEADPEHQRLYRRALLDLHFGVEDKRLVFLPPELDLPAELRLREELSGTLLCTEGLSDRPGFPEFWLRLPPRQAPGAGLRLLRMAAQAWKEAPFQQIEGLLSTRTAPILLPRGRCHLIEVCPA
ncbi:MAG TPA: hypothetical protein PLA94_20285 [Myxococcota bacterium]|nr:hypothetical protein [Myxococcota bacterium]HND32359.1 hypothetical protein [Myxococcota bacterium]